MNSRYGSLTFYSWTLALIAVAWLTFAFAGVQTLPPLWSMALCILACLFVFQFGVPAPRVGLISMERVPQVALLLTLGAPVAAMICAGASLIWPMVNRRYNQNSRRVALLRGVHNAGMTVVMLMAAHLAYVAAGGAHPLRELDESALMPLGVLAVVAQVVNIGLMTLFFKFDGRDVRQIITPSYALSDFIFVPAGVLAALLFNTGATSILILFIVLMSIFVLSFSRIGRSEDNLESKLGPLAKIFQSRRALHGARNVGELGDRIVHEARSLFRFDELHIALVDQGRHQIEVRTYRRDGAEPARSTVSLSSGLYGWLVEYKSSVLVSDWSRAPSDISDRALTCDKQTGSILMVPLLEQNEVIGGLRLQHEKQGVFGDADRHLLERLGEEVAVAIADARAFEDADQYRVRLEQRVAERTEELEKTNGEKERLIAALRERSLALERESREDPLTGVANRRHFMQRLAAEFEVAAAVGQPLTLAIADLDHFKDVNDLLGHRIGDEVLRQCAVVMRGVCRDTDLIARIGGEEFAVVLPGTACDAAIRLCENIRSATETHAWRGVHPDLRLTISIGLWQWDGKATVSELLHAADTQLYEAKRGGRNRVA